MNRILCLMLSAAMVFSLSVGATAATVDTFGEWAAQPTEDDSAYAVASYTSDAPTVTVPDMLGDKPVTAIAPHAFLTNTAMQSVTVPQPVREIGEFAFFECTALSAVTLPATLESIGEAAFSGCTALTGMNLNKTRITAVEAYTFAGTAMEELTLPASCTRINDNAFLNCAALQSVMIPRSVEEIGESAFDGCGQLTILCEEGSCAAAYAASHGIPCSFVNTVYPYLIGDADGDGKITVMDATRIQRILARLVTEDVEVCSMRGDVNGDGLRILDATAIQRSLAGMGNPYGIGDAVYG